MAEAKETIPLPTEYVAPPLPSEPPEKPNESLHLTPEIKCDAQNEPIQEVTDNIADDEFVEKEHDETSAVLTKGHEKTGVAEDEYVVQADDETSAVTKGHEKAGVAEDEFIVHGDGEKDHVTKGLQNIADDEFIVQGDDETGPVTKGLNGSEISEEEQNIYRQINVEKETITKCMDRIMESLHSFESDSQQKTNTINETFDGLIKALNDRKTALVNELNNDVLKQKSNVLDQIESLKQYKQTLTDMDNKYQSLTASNTNNDDDEKVSSEQRKKEILEMSQQFDAKYSNMECALGIKLILDTNELQSTIRNFGSVLIGKPGDLDYDPEKVPAFIDTNLDILLMQIPIKRLYRWIKEPSQKYVWQSRAQRSVISFYQNKKSYKVRMVLCEKESETDSFLMNQWVSKKELVEKEKLAWIWSGYDATIASEEKDEKKGYSKWCGMFYDDEASQRFAVQYHQARKINVQVLDNEEKLRQTKMKKERLEKIQQGIHDEGEDTEEYYENDEKLCFEVNIWNVYLWGNDASGKGAWISYAKKSLLQFFENRNNKKIRIVITENESKELRLNHWIPTDVTLKSRGDQIWEWQVYDELATKFIKNTTLKLATICATFIDKKDTEKFKQLFEKYQKINQKAEAI